MDSTAHAQSAHTDLTSKGLAKGKIGTFSGAVLGIASVAPAFTLATSIGVVVATAGFQMPAIFIAGFIPMVLTAYAYRELNNEMPDCGSSFTWATKAFGPYVGWMCGFGAVIASIIVLANLASVAMEFFYLIVADLIHQPALAELSNNKLVNVLTVIAFMALATLISTRGITSSERLQYVLVGIQMFALTAFVVCAFTQISRGTSPAAMTFSWSWLDPFTGLTFGTFVAGLMGSVFAFWGWDTCLTLGEESKDPQKSPGRAGVLCVATILPTYLIVGIAAVMYGGMGETGLGLLNPDNTENVIGAQAEAVLGHWGALGMFFAIFASTIAALQTTFLPVARTMLAMGVYRAFPHALSKVDQKNRIPRNATIVAGVVATTFYALSTLLLDSALTDTIAALGIMICWYYGITAFACVWYFRRELFISVRSIVFKLVFPLVGGLMLLGIFVASIVASMDPSSGSGAAVDGIGVVFFLGFGVLLIGIVLMFISRMREPSYFRGESLTRDTPALTDAQVDSGLAHLHTTAVEPVTARSEP